MIYYFVFILFCDLFIFILIFLFLLFLEFEYNEYGDNLLIYDYVLSNCNIELFEFLCELCDIFDILL